MVIYGVALLSFCMLVGVFVGDLLGEAIGVQANVGGVGIAMILLLVLSNLDSRELKLSQITEKGIGFWSAMYIPIVVAMAARQNVFSALSGGWMAIVTMTLTMGATASITRSALAAREPVSPGAARVRMAGLPAASAMLLPFRARAVEEC